MFQFCMVPSLPGLLCKDKYLYNDFQETIDTYKFKVILDIKLNKMAVYLVLSKSHLNSDLFNIVNFNVV